MLNTFFTIKNMFAHTEKIKLNFVQVKIYINLLTTFINSKLLSVSYYYGIENSKN